MALSRVSFPRCGLPVGSAKPFGLAAAALAAALLAGCGGDQRVGEPDPAVAGDAYTAAVSKPLTPSAEAGVSTPASLDAVPSLSGKVHYGVPTAAATGPGATLSGAVPFPLADAWNRDVTARAVAAASSALVATIGWHGSLRAGFGALAGVPYAVVDAAAPRVPVAVAGDPVPIAPSADAAARLAVVDRDAGVLYELRGAARDAASGGWTADAIAAWRLDLADATPIDAAGPDLDGGMPVFAGLVRRDEAANGAIRHALRITVPAVRRAWVAPARSAASGAPDASLLPLGARLRLKADVAIPADASLEARAILQALKTWDAARLAADLARIRGADFEVLALDPVTVR
ncbi:MAG TPA: hypothetical protein PKC20_11305 [Burkholderiaceae bacterium]|nr:hypothetical protein [Burkholderiaceae bacterium]